MKGNKISMLRMHVV